ncbi:hypothetical protein [Streptomyces sp. WY228]|uniref:hypothetical protein n=1 Tax=Streptomyces sp. WY228 TaxID=2855836 RepID=UPI001C502170|nr:hypothetical protein [Streptomyces sp. WY228]QXR01238.1 hypothetical protein KV381_36190 [Streptomyces sp. WY228]
MTTPAPAQLPGEPFSEALSEAAQAAAMSVRLFLTIADAVRRASRSTTTARSRRAVMPEGALHDLMADANWPVMARQLAGLQRAAST